jgi:DNA-binding Lrp family transcriptional regulator
VSEDAKRLDEIDRKIVQILQDDFPMVERPWKEIGDKLNITEDDVIKRLKRLNELGITRKIGPIIDSSRVGLTAATLVAMKVPKNKVDDVACTINEYGSVSHNYEREHEYNVWFTITASSNKGLTNILEEIRQKTGINPSDVLNLPTKQRFKINVRFQLT